MRRLFAFLPLLLLTACDERYGGGTVGTQPGTPTATRVAFTVQPSNAAVNVAINPSVQVAVQTGTGATATTSTALITVAIAPGTGTAGAVLTGATQVNAVNGVATFNNLRVDRAGTGYALTATSPNLTSAGSNGFNITP